MSTSEQVSQKLQKLVEEAKNVRIIKQGDWLDYVDNESWQLWSSSCLNLLHVAFGEKSIHYQNFKKLYDDYKGGSSEFESAFGIMQSATREWDEGFCTLLETRIAGETFSNFIILAKECLANGSKDASSVLASAALEDTLKKYGSINGLDVDNKDLSGVISTLKAGGLISGVEAKLVSTFPKLRNNAMHAEWDKISEVEVSAVIGFVEQFLLTKFSN